MDFRTIKDGNSRIYMYNIQNELVLNEPSYAFEWCSEDEYNYWRFMPNNKRRREFLAVRYILWRTGFRGELYYDNRIPKLSCGFKISISHSDDWIVVIINPDFVVGVDIERIRPKVKVISTKFVNDTDALYFDVNNLESLTLLWSFKETLYKMMRISGLSFLKQISVVRDENGEYNGLISTKGGNFKVPLAHKKFEEYVLTFNTGDAKKQ